MRVSGKDINELKNNLSSMLYLLEDEVEESPQLELPIEEPKKKVAKKVSKKKVSKKVSKKTSKKQPENIQEEPKKEEPKVEVVEAAPVSDKPITSEDVLSLLQRLNAEKGMEKAREVLSKYKCRRLSELKPEDYSAFAQSCEEAINE